MRDTVVRIEERKKKHPRKGTSLRKKNARVQSIVAPRKSVRNRRNLGRKDKTKGSDGLCAEKFYENCT